MRLRECREKANLSQKYVAISLGIAAPSVANWERDKTKPSLDNAIQLADLYEVSLDYLLGRSDLLFHPWHLHIDTHGYSWLFQSTLLLL